MAVIHRLEGCWHWLRDVDKFPLGVFVVWIICMPTTVIAFSTDVTFPGWEEKEYCDYHTGIDVDTGSTTTVEQCAYMTSPANGLALILACIFIIGAVLSSMFGIILVAIWLDDRRY